MEDVLAEFFARRREAVIFTSVSNKSIAVDRGARVLDLPPKEFLKKMEQQLVSEENHSISEERIRTFFP